MKSRSHKEEATMYRAFMQSNGPLRYVPFQDVPEFPEIREAYKARTRNVFDGGDVALSKAKKIT